MIDLTQPTHAAPEKPAHLYQARGYGEKMGDYQMVAEWWKAHTSERVFSEVLLPPTGIIVERDGEPVVACWAHLSAGIGVAFLECPVAKPGMTLGESSEAMNKALECIEAICRTHDYGILIANTLPAIATWLERRQGFARCGDRIQLVKRIDAHGT